MDRIKAHPEDMDLARQIAKATDWCAHLRVGPGEKYTTRGLPDYEAAKAEGERLAKQHSRFGRKAIIYAVNPLGNFPVDDRMIAIVRSL